MWDAACPDPKRLRYSRWAPNYLIEKHYFTDACISSFLALYWTCFKFAIEMNQGYIKMNSD